MLKSCSEERSERADYDEAPLWVRRAVCNGCGPYRLGWLVPDLLFREAGNRHDWDYTVGGGISDKARADLRFLARCVERVADKARAHTLAPLFCAALVYFVGVVLFGKRCFYWTRHPRTMGQMCDVAWEIRHK